MSRKNSVRTPFAGLLGIIALLSLPSAVGAKPLGANGQAGGGKTPQGGKNQPASLVDPQIYEYCSVEVNAGYFDPHTMAQICLDLPGSTLIRDQCKPYVKPSCDAIVKYHQCGTTSSATCPGKMGSGLRPDVLGSWRHDATSIPFGGTKLPARLIPYSFDEMLGDAASGSYTARVRNALVSRLRGRSSPNQTNSAEPDAAAVLAARHQSLKSGAINSCEEYVFRKYHPYSEMMEDTALRNPFETASVLLDQNGAQTLYDEEKGYMGQGMVRYSNIDIEWKPFIGMSTPSLVYALAPQCQQALIDTSPNGTDPDSLIPSKVPDHMECWPRPSRAYPLFPQTGTNQFDLGWVNKSLQLDDLKYHIKSRGSMPRNVFFQIPPHFLEDRNPGLYDTWYKRAGGTYETSFNGQVEFYIPESVKIQSIPDGSPYHDTDDGRDFERHQALERDWKAVYGDTTDVDWIDVESRMKNYVRLNSDRTDLLDQIACIDSGAPLQNGVCVPYAIVNPGLQTQILGQARFVSPEDLVSSRVDVLVKDKQFKLPGGALQGRAAIVNPAAFEMVAPGELYPLIRPGSVVSRDAPEFTVVDKIKAVSQFALNAMQVSGGSISPFLKTVATSSTKAGPGMQVQTARQAYRAKLVNLLDVTEGKLEESITYEITQGVNGCLYRPDQKLTAIGPIDATPPSASKGGGLRTGQAGSPVKKPVNTVGRSTNANLCDWTPRVFARDFVRGMRKEMEADYAQCITATADNFNALKAGVAKPVVVPDTWSQDAFDTNISKVNDYIHISQDKPLRMAMQDEVVGKWVNSQGVSSAPKLPGFSIGDSIGGSETIGDKDLCAIDYSYKAEWKVSSRAIGRGNIAGSSRPNIESLEGSSQANASLSLWLFGHKFTEVAGVDYTIETRPEDTVAHIPAGVRGKGRLRVKNLDQDNTISENDAALGSDGFMTGAYQLPSPNQSFPLYQVSGEKTIVVVVVPVTFRGAAAITAGLRNSGASGRNSTLENSSVGPKHVRFKMDGEFEPFIRADAMGSASVDALALEVGLRVDLNVLDISTPMSFLVETTPTTQVVAGINGINRTNIHIRRKGNLNLNALSGRFSAWAEVCFIDCERTDFDIFRWEGIRQTRSIADSDSTYNLVALGWSMYGIACQDQFSCGAP